MTLERYRKAIAALVVGLIGSVVSGVLALIFGPVIVIACAPTVIAFATTAAVYIVENRVDGFNVNDIVDSVISVAQSIDEDDAPAPSDAPNLEIVSDRS
ncbi:MAG: hypothetical protein AAF376_08970 [Pseudomonadota bacterium]